MDFALVSDHLCFSFEQILVHLKVKKRYFNTTDIMFDFIEKKVKDLGKNKAGDEDKKDEKSSPSTSSFCFGRHDVEPYQYPNLYDEANEMCQVSMLIYRCE